MNNLIFFPIERSFIIGCIIFGVICLIFLLVEIVKNKCCNGNVCVCYATGLLITVVLILQFSFPTVNMILDEEAHYKNLMAISNKKIEYLYTCMPQESDIMYNKWCDKMMSAKLEELKYSKEFERLEEGLNCHYMFIAGYYKDLGHK